MSVHNNRVSKHVTQKLTELLGKTDKPTIILYSNTILELLKKTEMSSSFLGVVLALKTNVFA